jgi:putative hydrolase of the HAD superfamily
MMPVTLNHIDTWIFDLDNTLYPASCNLFALIDEKMTHYIQNLLGSDFDTARATQKDYFRSHGTTLSGLMAHHTVDPHEFLDFVHDIDMARLIPNASLNQAIEALPGRKLVFTNGNETYAQRVLDALGLSTTFEAIHDIHAIDYIAKPDPRGYDTLCSTFDINPTRAFFAEDMARNLRPAKALGMATLWINNGSEHGNHDACESYIDHETHDLSHWLNTHLELEPA